MHSDGPIERTISVGFRQKPVVAVAVLAAAILGWMAYQDMPRNVYPDFRIPVFTVVTENEAMAPEEIESLITRPMEAAMNGLPGIQRVRSQTTQGLSSVVVEFGLDSEFWRARQFVSERMAQVSAQLPPGTEPPALSSATTRLAEIYELAIEGTLPLAEMREIADWEVRYALLTVPGVAEVLNMGGAMRQYRITLRPERLQALGVRLSEVEQAIREGGENASGGFISTGTSEINVRGIGRYASLDDLRLTVIAARGGVPVYLGDVANVEAGAAIRRGIATRNGRETIVCLVIKQPDADAVRVVAGVERALDELRQSLPEGVVLRPYYDQTHLIHESLDGVVRAILIGAVLVVIVLLALLGDLWGTLIVAATLPLSVLIAGLVLRSLGVGLNTMSLGGLAIAVGIMVDASIIMVENIHHRLATDRGSDRAGLALTSAIEVGRPIAFATLIIIAVFLPMYAMGGIEGLLFRPLAVTVAAAMTVALALSLTLTPSLAGRFLGGRKTRVGEPHVMRALQRLYVPVLGATLRSRGTVLAVAAVLLIPTGYGLIHLGRDFMPSLDEGAWFISTVTPPDTSLEENHRLTAQVEKVLLAEPDIVEVIKRNGRSERAIGCVLPVNSGEFFVNLRPRSARTRPVEQTLARVRHKLETIPGVAAAFTQPLQNKIDESLEGTPAPLQVRVFGSDVRRLASAAETVRKVMEGVPGLDDIKVSEASGIPQLLVTVDRRAAARHGVSVAAVSETVRLAIGGEEVAQVARDQRTYGVFMRFPEASRRDAESIGRILVDTPSGSRVPLSRVAAVAVSEGPNVIWREAMSRRVSVDAAITGRDLAGVVADIRQGLNRQKLPEGCTVVFGGQYESQRRAMVALSLATGLALVSVFALLYLALNSVSQAALILATVPSALVGGVTALWLAGETLNVSSAVGFIAVFGIAVQNSLVLLTQINDLVRNGRPYEEAVRVASVQRLRPKLMTALCAALGLVPILMTNAVGAEIEKPLAIVMVGGLVSSTLFTLVVLPAACVAAVGILDRGLRGPHGPELRPLGDARRE